nr:hypothetical protein [Leuconostoc carnosum]
MATIHLYLASTNHQSTNITATTPAAWVVILRYADHQKALNDGGYGHTETSLALGVLLYQKNGLFLFSYLDHILHMVSIKIINTKCLI